MKEDKADKVLVSLGLIGVLIASFGAGNAFGSSAGWMVFGLLLFGVAALIDLSQSMEEAAQIIAKALRRQI